MEPTFVLLRKVRDRLVRRLTSRSSSRSIGKAQREKTTSNSRGSVGLREFRFTALLSGKVEVDSRWFLSIVQATTFIDTASPFGVEVNRCRGRSQGSIERYPGLAKSSRLIGEVQVATFGLGSKNGDSKSSHGWGFGRIIVAVSSGPVSGVDGIENQIGEGKGCSSGGAVHVGKTGSGCLSSVGVEATFSLRWKGVSAGRSGSGDAYTFGPCFGPVGEPLDVINWGRRRRGSGSHSSETGSSGLIGIRFDAAFSLSCISGASVGITCENEQTVGKERMGFRELLHRRPR